MEHHQMVFQNKCKQMDCAHVIVLATSPKSCACWQLLSCRNQERRTAVHN